MATRKRKTRSLAIAGPAKRTLVGITVKFELNAKNGLRRIRFGLAKSTDGEKVKWTIKFELFEREKKSEAYGDPLIALDVELDTKLNKKAERAADKGLTAGQAAFALGPAADDARDAANNELDEDEAKDTVQSTLKKK